MSIAVTLRAVVEHRGELEAAAPAKIRSFNSFADRTKQPNHQIIMTSSITFYAIKSESLWEAGSHGSRGGYQAKPRWTKVHPSEATHFKWEAPSQTITPCSGHPTHRYPEQRIEALREDIRRWAIEVLKEGTRPERLSIEYATLTFKIVKDGHARGIPAFIKQALKAFAINARENHESSDWLETYYPIAVAGLPVQPLYLEKSDFFEDPA